ncbi:hypothetical protein [Kingella sp. (in: b-proteobacteria)]|nr:hypothetical protein [Kingella sp. (in: b-proteobacteria)]MDO4657006.1 hypothetical protein [Kingella sp. (in: b-proteobacteria)]
MGWQAVCEPPTLHCLHGTPRQPENGIQNSAPFCFDYDKPTLVSGCLMLF